MANIKELPEKQEKFVPGHRTCAGCGIPIIVRMVLAGTDKPVVVSNATGCLEVCSTIYPFTSWNVPYIHNTFENAAATLSGVETAFRVLKKKGKVGKDIRFVAFGGDGGTYDIGLQSLSGALERGHKMVYVCYDNEAYMNTGNQRSGASPYGGSTTTDPAGTASFGKKEWRKNLAKIAAAHNIPYVATASIANYPDLIKKAEKAFEADGPAVLVILSPCTLFWRIKTDMAEEISRLAVESKFWPLYEIEKGVYKINYVPKKPVPVSEFMKPQGRFRHLFDPEENKEVLNNAQAHAEKEWRDLEKLSAQTEK